MSAKQLLVPKELQQKVARSHQRQLTELTIVSGVVGDNDITASGNSTLVLQQVLEITNILMIQCSIQLGGIARKDCYPLTELADKAISFQPRHITLDIVDIGKCEIRCTRFKSTILSQFIYHSALHGILSFFGKVHKDIGIKKHFHRSPSIYRVRSSAASSGVSRRRSNKSCVSGEMFISAIFLARNSSSALRLASSASCMASCRKSTTAFISLTFILLITSMYGAIGVACTLFVATVIKTPFF